MTPNTMNDDDDVHIDFNSQHTMQSKQNSEAGKGPAVVAIQGVWHLPLTCLTDPGSRSDSTTRINKVSELTMFCTLSHKHQSLLKPHSARRFCKEAMGHKRQVLRSLATVHSV